MKLSKLTKRISCKYSTGIWCTFIVIKGYRFLQKTKMGRNVLFRSFLCTCTLGVPFPSENDISGNIGQCDVLRPYTDSSCQEQSISAFGFT